MALLDIRKRLAIQEVVDRWRDRCLQAQGSLLFDDKQVWTPAVAFATRQALGVTRAGERGVG